MFNCLLVYYYSFLLLFFLHSGLLSILILLDLTATFDTISHTILLDMLASIFKYLTHGLVQIIFLCPHSIHSIENLHISIYLTALLVFLRALSSGPSSSPIMSSLLVTSSENTSISTVMLTTLSSISEILLKLNSAKSEVLLIGSKSTLTKLLSFSIHLDNSSVPPPQRLSARVLSWTVLCNYKLINSQITWSTKLIFATLAACLYVTPNSAAILVHTPGHLLPRLLQLIYFWSPHKLIHKLLVQNTANRHHHHHTFHQYAFTN